MSILIKIVWLNLSCQIQFLGAKAVFWDLRHAFLFCLYCGNVEGSRLDAVLTRIDTVRH